MINGVYTTSFYYVQFTDCETVDTRELVNQYSENYLILLLQSFFQTNVPYILFFILRRVDQTETIYYPVLYVYIKFNCLKDTVSKLTSINKFFTQ